jgi:hypothetical protein
MLKSLRLALVTGALVLGLGAGAQAAVIAPAPTPDPTDLTAPDCLYTCSKTLGPGDRLVVSAPYAFHGATVSGSATAFGARFVVKRSTDGRTFTKVYETPFTTSFGPITFSGAGYYRVVAINDSTWLTTTATGTVSPF